MRLTAESIVTADAIPHRSFNAVTPVIRVLGNYIVATRIVANQKFDPLRVCFAKKKMRRLFLAWGTLAAVVFAIDSAAGDVSGNKEDDSMLSAFANQLQTAQQQAAVQQQGGAEQLQQSAAQQLQGSAQLSSTQGSGSLLSGEVAGSAEARSDAEAGGACHPQCSWKCDTPVCNQVRFVRMSVVGLVCAHVRSLYPLFRRFATRFARRRSARQAAASCLAAVAR